jgi:hypothetical protein
MRMRHALRRDDCEAEIVKALRAAGVAVEVVGRPLDLACAVRAQNGSWRHVYLECKDDDGRLTKAQVEFINRWPGEIHIVRSPSEALKACFGDSMK